MENFKALSVSELLELTSHPKFSSLVYKEHAEVMDVPLKGTTSQSLKPENSKKNRYSNIPCWDHSLVIVNPRESLTFDKEDLDFSKMDITTNDNASSYIHANFVDGYEVLNKYICAQTPMEDTWETFFEMIWEQESSVMVSLTDLDRDHEKSYQLWSRAQGSEITYGRYVIRILDIREDFSFTKTQVQITNKKTEESREITNFWFTDWPDYSIPTGVEEFLELRNKVNQEQCRLMKEADNDSQTPGPIVVLCSTGTGWAGTYCAIDNALEQLEKEKKVLLSEIVLKIRSQRYSGVFLPEQYLFCYIMLRHVLEEEAKNKLLSQY